jgi:hypothetical protein
VLDCRPFRALARSASQRTQRNWKKHRFSSRTAPTQRRAVAGRFYQCSPIANLRIGPRSAPLECLVVRTVATLGRSVARAAELRHAGRLDGFLQGESGWHL